MLDGKQEDFRMSVKPKPKKRPADVVANAVHVMRVLTGENDDTPTPGKNAAAAALGKLGGKARSVQLHARQAAHDARNGCRYRDDIP